MVGYHSVMKSYDRLFPELPSFCVPPALARQFQAAGPAMIATVNARVQAHSGLPGWLGGRSYRMLELNHENHHAFMSTVFVFSQYGLLARTLPWVYRSYMGQGLGPDYFPAALTIWLDVVRARLGDEGAAPILEVYEWMIRSHERLLEAAAKPPEDPPPMGGTWDDLRAPVLEALFQGDARRALELVTPKVRVPEDLVSLYIDLLQPLLVQVGDLWETGRISVAQEHLASAVVGRVMAGFATFRLSTARQARRAIVTSAPNELHEIGAWMLADLLELGGWHVRYLGANVPEHALLDMLEEFRPALVAISVTMPYHLERALELMHQARAKPSLAGLRVMVGGLAVRNLKDLILSQGVDGTAADAAEAVALAEAWMEQAS